MLKPEMLENIIRNELNETDHLLWEVFPSESTIPLVVKEAYKHRIKLKTHFFWANLALLMAKSLTDVIPKPIIRIAALIEILVIGRGLKQEAVRTQWSFPDTNMSECNHSFTATPGILNLSSDYLIGYCLERLASFNVNYFVQGFAKAHKDFIEAELLLKTNSVSEKFSETDYLALVKLRIESFASHLALGICKLCKAPQEATEGFVCYAKHFGMALALYQELIPLYAVHSAALPATNILKLTALNYPILYALRHAAEDEKQLIKRCFLDLSHRKMELIKPICKILDRYDIASHILELIQTEVQLASHHLGELNLNGDQALYGLLEIFTQQCSSQTQILIHANNHM